MAESIRLPFERARFPEGRGALTLLEDGRFFIEPSEAMLERLAAREQEIVEGASRASWIAATAFAALAAASLAAGWYAGRVGGRLRELYTRKRAAGDATLDHNAGDGLRLRFHAGRLKQCVTLHWTPDEYAEAGEDRAERFTRAFMRIRREGAD